MVRAQGAPRERGQRPAVPALLLPAEPLPAGGPGETPTLPKPIRETFLKQKL